MEQSRHDALENLRPRGMVLLRGDEMDADSAAWAEIADAADRALRLPGLSPLGLGQMERLAAASRRAAGLPLDLRPFVRPRLG